MTSLVVVAYTRLLRKALVERENVIDELHAGNEASDEWAEVNDNVAEAAQNLLDAIGPEGRTV